MKENVKTIVIFSGIVVAAVIIFFAVRGNDNDKQYKADQEIKTEFGKIGTELFRMTARDSSAIWELINVSVKLDSFAFAHDGEIKDLKKQVSDLEKKKNSSNNYVSYSTYKKEIENLNFKISVLEKQKDKVTPPPDTNPDDGGLIIDGDDEPIVEEELPVEEELELIEE